MIQVREINIPPTSEIICKLKKYDFWGKGNYVKKYNPKAMIATLC